MYKEPTYEEIDQLVGVVEEFIKRFNMPLFEFERNLYFNMLARSWYAGHSAGIEAKIKLNQGFTIPIRRFIEIYLSESGMSVKEFRMMMAETARRLTQLKKPGTQELLENAARILGVSVKSTIEEIKLAYRKLVKDTHPDLHPNDPQAEEKFKKINKAYEFLVEYGNVLVNRKTIINERDAVARDEVRKRKSADRIVVASGYPNDIRRLDRIRESLEKAGIPFEVKRVEPDKNEVGAMMRKTVIYVADEYKEKAMNIIKGRR